MYPNINHMEEMIYSTNKAQTLMDPIIKYLKDGKLPTDNKDAKKLRFKAAYYYIIEDGVLYKQDFFTPYLYCLSQMKQVVS